MTQEQAKMILDRIIDDGTEEEKFQFDEGVLDATHREQVLYYALCALVEAIIREMKNFSYEEVFVKAVKKTDSWLCNQSAETCQFDDDWYVMSDWRMQEVLRIGNELGLSTPLCAKLQQIILEDAEYPPVPTEKIYSGGIITQVMNFMFIMAYAEVMKVLERDGFDVVETLSTWQELPISSDYFARLFMRRATGDLSIELPSTDEANAAHWALQMSPFSMPLLSESLRVYERITGGVNA